MLLIAWENAHSRYFSEDAFKNASEPKELMIIPNGVHTDLYDKIDVIPFDKLETFFKENLQYLKGIEPTHNPLANKDLAKCGLSDKLKFCAFYSAECVPHSAFFNNLASVETHRLRYC